MEMENTKSYQQSVHYVLAHAYSVYFILLLIGICFDFIFNIKIFSNSITVSVGASLLLLASFIILWAQKTGRDFDKTKAVEEVKTEHFCRGPYCYTRIPTQWGLFLLMLGFGFITSAFFVILTTLISFFIARFIFIDKQERILAEKYGTPYLEYKKLVKF